MSAEQNGRVLPAGTVTFLFSDIEGSSRRWEQEPEEMARQVARHDELLAHAIGGAGGTVVKWTGDGVLAVFADAGGAVTAAVAAQQALAADPDGVQARMGIHAGTAAPDGADYHGPTVNRAARIMGLAHGGQVLLSGVVAALVAEMDGLELLDLGRHPLRDLANPELIHQVVAPGLRAAFPPISAASAVPESRSSFVGREEEVHALARSLVEHRLLTLTGVGGVGKTRLALEAARSAAAAFDRVGVVELAPIADPDVVVGAVAAAMRAPVGAEFGSAVAPDVSAALVAYLGVRRNLVVLDNCEHLLDACAELVELILASCPATTILATSREALEVDGEQTYRVPSLDAQDAVALFAARAAAVGSGPAAVGADAGAVADICRRLDGIPLAIELAASRTSHLSATEIAARLDDRFRLLVGGARRRVQRQQTLQATLDWSHDLLDAREQALLRRLAVFVGGCDLAAVEAVCGTGIGAVVDVLASLVAKSLVVADTTAAPTRYRLLETVRLYAQDKLIEAGEADAARSSHHDHYLSWGESLEPRYRLFDGTTLALLRVERDNLRGALDWSASHDDHEAMARLVRVLLLVWWEDAEAGEAAAWIARIDDDRLDPTLAADVAAMRALLAVLTLETPERWTELAAVGVARSGGAGWAGSASWIAAAMGRAMNASGDPIEALDAAADAAAATGLDVWVAFSTSLRSSFRLTAGDLELGLRDAEEADAAADIGITRLSRAIALFLVGRYTEAYEVARAASSGGEGLFVSDTLDVMTALARVACGEVDAGARDLAVGAKKALAEAVSPQAVPTWLLGFAVRAAAEGDVARAGRILGSIDRPPGWRMSFITQALPIFTHYRTWVREAVGPDDARRLRDEGRAIPRRVMLEREVAASDA